MKTINFSRVIHFLLVVAISGISACENMESTYKDFIGNGEIKYSAKPDSIKARGGLNRLELSWLFVSDPNITKYKVTWNNGKDSVVNGVERSPGVDTVRLMLENLQEGTYNFEITTYDKKGNSSVKAETVGKVYGERYQRSLLPRSFSATSREGNDMNLNWVPSSDDMNDVYISYHNSKGEEVKLVVEKGASTTKLVDFPLYSSFTMRSTFLPEPKALDEFQTATETIKFGPKYFTGWSSYNLLMGHGNVIVGRSNAGALHRFGLAADGSLLPAAQIGTGWAGFTSIFSLGDPRLVTWRIADGYGAIYTIGDTGGFGATPVFAAANSANANQIRLMNLLFSCQNQVFGRDVTTGALRYFTLNSASVATGPVAIDSPEDWNRFNAIVGAGKWIFARTPDGKLFRTEVSLTKNNTSELVEVATGWNKYSVISTFKGGLLTVQGGEMWHFPVSTTGEIGTPELIKIIIGEGQIL